LIEHEKMRAEKKKENKKLVAEGKNKKSIPAKRKDPY